MGGSKPVTSASRVHIHEIACSLELGARQTCCGARPIFGCADAGQGLSPVSAIGDEDQRKRRGRSASKHTDITVRMKRYLTGTFRTDSWLRLTAAIGFGQRSNVAFEALPG